MHPYSIPHSQLALSHPLAPQKALDLSIHRISPAWYYELIFVRVELNFPLSCSIFPIVCNCWAISIQVLFCSQSRPNICQLSHLIDSRTQRSIGNDWIGCSGNFQATLLNIHWNPCLILRPTNIDTFHVHIKHLLELKFLYYCGGLMLCTSSVGSDSTTLVILLCGETLNWNFDSSLPSPSPPVYEIHFKSAELVVTWPLTRSFILPSLYSSLLQTSVFGTFKRIFKFVPGMYSRVRELLEEVLTTLCPATYILKMVVPYLSLISFPTIPYGICCIFSVFFGCPILLKAFGTRCTILRRPL